MTQRDHGRRGTAVAVLIFGLLGGLGVAQPPEQPGPSLVTIGCHETWALLHVPLEVAQDTLPPRYTALEAENGMGEVFVRSGMCDSQSVDGVPSGASILDHVAINICSPRGPVRSPAGVVEIDLYELELATNSRSMRDWFLQGAPGFPIRLAADMVFDHRPSFGRDPTFVAAAPVPAQSPRRWRASIVESIAPTAAPVTLRMWNDLPNGDAVLVTIDIVGAPAFAEGVITTQPGSNLAELLGTTRAEFTTPDGLASDGNIGLHGHHDSRLTKRVLDRDQFPAPDPDPCA